VTEREQFEAMLNRAGVPFSSDSATVRVEVPEDWTDNRRDAALHGYHHFYCEWDFNEAGELVSVGIYE
jgi:hypothetical protein